MKKVFAWGICGMLTFVLLGCQGKDVGVIGGADGPTVVFVADGDEEHETDMVKVVNIDGTLYVETGKNSDNIPRCGNMDGNVKKGCDMPEVPLGCNEANFNVGDSENVGYQWGKEGTVEIPIDGEWKIFKKIYDPEKDLTQYKYIIKLKGEVQYLFKEAEYTVLTNDLGICANDVAKSFFSSDYKDWLDIYVVSFGDEE